MMIYLNRNQASSKQEGESRTSILGVDRLKVHWNRYPPIRQTGESHGYSEYVKEKFYILRTHRHSLRDVQYQDDICEDQYYWRHSPNPNRNFIQRSKSYKNSIQS